MEIKIIEHNSKHYQQMLVLRMQVLLNPIGIPFSYINVNKEKYDILIGAFEQEVLIGCCVLTRKDKETVQLRQMAVATEQQQKGIGAAIVLFAENWARQNGYSIVIMHARNNVIAFYQKCGYEIVGKEFMEVGIAHRQMQKQLI